MHDIKLNRTHKLKSVALQALLQASNIIDHKDYDVQAKKHAELLSYHFFLHFSICSCNIYIACDMASPATN